MSTKKDLVEAHAFSRRRLVTAFVSGAPGGREVEPSRPGRTVVGGVALGVLVLAGGAIAGVFSGRPPDGWLDPGLVVAEGSLYAITETSDDPELRPVDPISGRLIFGIGTEPSSVSVDDVAQQRLGDDIGILGAPSYLPSAGDLIDEGWTACTDPGAGTALRLAATPGVTATEGTALVVTSGEQDTRWLIAYGVVDDDRAPQAFRYRLPADEGAPERVLGALGLPSTADEAPQVSEEWLNLWPQGPAVTPDSFDVGDTGDGVVADSVDWFGLEEPARAGDLVTVGDQTYLVRPDEPGALSDFALEVYRAVAGPVELDGSVLETGTGRATPDEWPDAVPTAVADGSLCPMLVPRDGEPPTVLIADDPDADTVPAPEPGGGSGGDPGEGPSPYVEPGRGAFVLVGGFGDATSGSPYVVDATGVAYLLEGQDAVENLGYGGQEPRVVPDSWTNLLGCGVPLSREAALRPPELGSQPEC